MEYTQEQLQKSRNRIYDLLHKARVEVEAFEEALAIIDTELSRFSISASPTGGGE